jgi:hypothetical protein
MKRDAPATKQYFLQSNELSSCFYVFSVLIYKDHLITPFLFCCGYLHLLRIYYEMSAAAEKGEIAAASSPIRHRGYD